MPAKGGKAPKRKGDAFERAVCLALGGRRTFWQPEGGEERGDIEVPGLGIGECKVRKNGFKQLYEWLEGRDFLVVKADRRPALVILPLAVAAALLQELDESDKSKDGPPQGG